MKAWLSRVRLLPLVIVCAAALLAVRVAGLVEGARAQDQAQAPNPANVSDLAPQRASHGDDADDQETSSSEVDVLTALARRRSELDARTQQLQLQQNLLAATEKRIDGKIADMKTLQAQLQTLLGERDTAQRQEVTNLVKTYASMRPREAARIFDSLSDTVLVPVASQMKPDVLGAILAQMQPEAAEKLTVKLAGRLSAASAAPAQPPASAPQTPAPAPTPAATPATSDTSPTAAPAAAQEAPAAAQPQPSTANSGATAGKAAAAPAAAATAASAK